MAWTIAYMNDLIPSYRECIADAIEAIEQSLGSGGAANWEEYNRKTGQIAGLKKADRMLQDVIEQLRREDDAFLEG